MVFIILIVLGIIGLIGTLWFSAGSLRYVENPVAQGSEWYSVSPDVLESKLGLKIREELRKVLKVVLIWLIKIYRDMSQKITLKETVKKQVRAFLYEHKPDGERNPSEFWDRVRHPTKPKTARKPRVKKEKIQSETVQLVETIEQALDVEENG